MTALDNSIRYKFAPLSSGAFFFPTDEGCDFTITIAEAGYYFWKSDMLSNDDKVFKLTFERRCDEEDFDCDEAVCNTIIHIISSNMASMGDLSIYYHIWKDGNTYTYLVRTKLITMDQQLFEIRDTHKALLQIVIYNSAIQKTLSETIIKKLAKLNGEDEVKEIKDFHSSLSKQHLILIDTIYAAFGILPLKDILNVPDET